MIVRRYDASTDAATLRAWLDAWFTLPTAAPLPLLPPFGVAAVEGDALQAIAFLSETDAGYAHVVNCVGDRALPHGQRRAALRKCLEALAEEADRRGLALIAYSSRHSVVSLFRELGWSTPDKNMVQLARPARALEEQGR